MKDLTARAEVFEFLRLQRVSLRMTDAFSAA